MKPFCRSSLLNRSKTSTSQIYRLTTLSKYEVRRLSETRGISARSVCHTAHGCLNGCDFTVPRRTYVKISPEIHRWSNA